MTSSGLFYFQLRSGLPCSQTHDVPKSDPTMQGGIIHLPSPVLVQPSSAVGGKLANGTECTDSLTSLSSATNPLPAVVSQPSDHSMPSDICVTQDAVAISTSTKQRPLSTSLELPFDDTSISNKAAQISSDQAIESVRNMASNTNKSQPERWMAVRESYKTSVQTGTSVAGGYPPRSGQTVEKPPKRFGTTVGTRRLRDKSTKERSAIRSRKSYQQRSKQGFPTQVNFSKPVMVISVRTSPNLKPR